MSSRGKLAWGRQIIDPEIVGDAIKDCISNCKVFILGVATLCDDAAHTRRARSLQPDEAVLNDNAPTHPHTTSVTTSHASPPWCGQNIGP